MQAYTTESTDSSGEARIDHGGSHMTRSIHENEFRLTDAFAAVREGTCAEHLIVKANLKAGRPIHGAACGGGAATIHAIIL